MQYGISVACKTAIRIMAAGTGFLQSVHSLLSTVRLFTKRGRTSCGTGVSLSALSVHSNAPAGEPGGKGTVTVVVGDAKGAVRVWEIADCSKLTRGCGAEEAEACFQQVCFSTADRHVPCVLSE